MRLKALSNKERLDWIGHLTRARRECIDARRVAALGADASPTPPSSGRASRASRDSGYGYDAFVDARSGRDSRDSRDYTNSRDYSNYGNGRDRVNGGSAAPRLPARPSSMVSTASAGYDDAQLGLSPPVQRRSLEPGHRRSGSYSSYSNSGGGYGGYGGGYDQPGGRSPPALPPTIPKEGEEVVDYEGHKASMYDHEF